MKNKRQTLAEEAIRLRSLGFTQQQIADRMGISRSYACSLYTDPNRTKELARRAVYAGICDRCGATTSGSEGPTKAPKHCDPCARAIRHENRKWTRESVIDAIQRFAEANGRPPVSEEWIRSDPDLGYPPRSSVYQSCAGRWTPFKSWADAIAAAGFPRPQVGHKTGRQKVAA